MARELRIEYPGTIYHVMNRGDRRELIFHGDQDRESFCETLAGVCAKTGWQVSALGLKSNQFREKLLREMRDHTAPNHGGEARRESEQSWAAQMLADELKRHGWTAADLAQRLKGDPEKLQISRRLRRETTMTLPWIAGQLNMGAAGALANLLRGPGRT